MLDIPQCEVVDVLPQSLSTHPIVAPFREAAEPPLLPDPSAGRACAAGGRAEPDHDHGTIRSAASRPGSGCPRLTARWTANRRFPCRPQRPPQVPPSRRVGRWRCAWSASARSLERRPRPGLLRLNWVTDREHRIAVPPRDPDLRLMPRDDPSAMVRVTRFAQFQLPGAVALLGLLVWFQRTRGSRRRPVASKQRSSA